MHTRHADIVDALDARAQPLQRERGFFGHRQIRRACRDHRDKAIGLRRRKFADGDDARCFKIPCLWELLLHGCHRFTRKHA